MMSILILALALSVGVVSAHPEGAEDNLTEDSAPVGSAIQPGHPGRDNGNFNGIDNNPLCPLHHDQT